MDINNQKLIKMKTYKVKVRETHYCEREYFINADSKAAARKAATICEYEDAGESYWYGEGKAKVLKIEDSETDLTTF